MVRLISTIVRELVDNKLSNIFPPNLKGACAITSYILFLSLRKNGFNSKFVIGKYLGLDHCWVELNKSIIDLTATQFCCFNKINVFKINDIRYTAIKKRIIKKDFIDWYLYQNPFNFSIKWKNNLPSNVFFAK